MKFEFKVYQPVAGAKSTVRPALVIVEGATFDEALARLGETHPGHGIAEHMRGLWRVVS